MTTHTLLLPQERPATTSRSGSCAACSTASWRTTSCACASARTSRRASSTGCPCRRHIETNLTFTQIAELSPARSALGPRRPPRRPTTRRLQALRRAQIETVSTRSSFVDILETLPLVTRADRDAAFAAFYDIGSRDRARDEHMLHVTTEDRAPVWAIWLLIAFGAAQPLAWVAWRSASPRHPVAADPAAGRVGHAAGARRASRPAGSRRCRAVSRRQEQEHTRHARPKSTSSRRRTRCSRSSRARSTCRWPSRRWRPRSPGSCRAIASASRCCREDGREFQTYTARVQQDERRSRPRPEIVFKVERTVLGGVVRSREPLIIDDIKAAAPDFLDANILHTLGIQVRAPVPLVSKGRAVGTINVVSRQPERVLPARTSTRSSRSPRSSPSRGSRSSCR